MNLLRYFKRRIVMRRSATQRVRSLLFLLFLALVFFLYSRRLSVPDVGNPGPALHSFGNISLVVLSGRPGKDGQKPTDETAKEEAAGMSCRIPELKVDDPILKGFFEKMAPLKCGKEPNWILSKKTTLEFDPEILKAHPDITCDLTYFWFKSDYDVTYSEKKKGQKAGTPLESDYFIAECASSDGSKYKNYHSTVLANKETVTNLSGIKQPGDWSGLNVYILGFDSISHMTAQRTLPKTYKYLVEKHDMVFLDGYNIVGDGTPQALIPILTSKTEEELPLTRKRFNDAKHVDEAYPFIWNDFSKAGYVTQFGEDTAAVGMFTYRLKGFAKQPTDSYLRSFYLVAEKEGVWKSCMGNGPQHVTFMDEAEAFFAAYPTTPKFSLMFHGALSHDDLNKVQLADEDVIAHIERMQSKGFLDNTLFIFMADHGHRFAKIRETQQGQLEERLPMFGFSLPKSFKEGKGKVAWENLKGNVKKLSSPFDIYPTLKAILNWPSSDKPADLKQRSLSLWSKIPQERTCAQAGIDPHWCTCLNWEQLKVDEPSTVLLSEAIVEAINRETERERKLCSPLKLSKIESSKRLVPHENLLKYKNVKDPDGFVPDLSGKTEVAFAHYQIRLRTMPGDALFEATVKFDSRIKQATVNLGTVSHVNKYGDQPHCVIDKDYFLAKWCVCYDKI